MRIIINYLDFFNLVKGDISESDHKKYLLGVCVLITKYKVDLLNGSDTTADVNLFKQVNLEYLKENSPVIYFEASIHKAISQFLQNNILDALHTLMDAFNFFVIYTNFRKK